MSKETRHLDRIITTTNRCSHMARNYKNILLDNSKNIDKIRELKKNEFRISFNNMVKALEEYRDYVKETENE